MKARIAASAIAAAGLILGLSGCGMITPVATGIHYNASDGISATFGKVALRNVFVVTNTTSDGKNNGSLVFTAINSGDDAARVDFEYSSNGATQHFYLDLAPRETKALGVGDVKPIQLTGIDTPAGALLSMYVQAGTAEGQTLQVPVLDESMIAYQDLGPINTATATPAP